MQDSSIQIRVPQSLLNYGLRTEDIQQLVTEWLTLSLFTRGQISSGKAASLLGISRVQFLSLLRRYGVAYIDFTSEEIAEELSAANQIEKETRS